MASLPVKVSDALVARRQLPAPKKAAPSTRPALRRPAYEVPTDAPAKPQLRAVAWTGNLLVGVFLLGFGVWSMLAPLKSAAIATGVVEPESSRKTIQHLEGGIVRDILVKNGETVVPGQVLIKLDDTKPRAEFDSLQTQLWDAEASHARLVAEQQNQDRISFPLVLLTLAEKNASMEAILSGQKKIFEARHMVMQSEIAVTNEKMNQVKQEIAGLTAQQEALTTRAELTRQQLDAISSLVAKGVERKTKLLDLGQMKADLDGQIGETAAQISRAYQVISEAQASLVKIESDRQNEIAQNLRDTESQILQMGDRLQATDDQLSRTDVRAPQAGVVVDLRIHTTGGVVGAGEPLLDLVPADDRLIVSAHVRPEDINLVHPGLKAQVHLLPYNQRRVPLLKGEVAYVSADRLTDKATGQSYYAATIRITDERVTKTGEIDMVPGMPAQALIETGQSSVAFYLLRPLFDSFNRSFREN
ncbi:HlyD family type I secretion periplasmic adaptor subunit [Mesorhizobium sp. SP-1A]|uniref:HlyD family type I secretion periplasmic adaptor subunit n=1 Tax=Mesorhizobium sp. SP-1A TaxID=3077840 RepID=UPI0039655FDC